MVDEMAMLTAYGDRADVREALRLLAEILTQGRACLVSVIGLRAGALQGHRRRPRAVHHPHLPRRHRRQPRRHGAGRRRPRTRRAGRRDPRRPTHAGIGFVIDTGSRLPVRFRAAYVADDEIDELVTRCAPPTRTSAAASGADDRGRRALPAAAHRHRDRRARRTCVRDHCRPRPHRRRAPSLPPTVVVGRAGSPVARRRCPRALDATGHHRRPWSASSSSAAAGGRSRG